MTDCLHRELNIVFREKKRTPNHWKEEKGVLNIVLTIDEANKREGEKGPKNWG